jgi:hypothetical protein
MLLLMLCAVSLCLCLPVCAQEDEPLPTPGGRPISLGWSNTSLARAFAPSTSSFWMRLPRWPCPLRLPALVG